MARKIHTDYDYQNVSRPINLPPATASGHPVTYDQLNAAIEAVAWKDDVRVSTQSNINLSAPGASINGITMVSLDRFLARFQTDPTENGLYVWNGAAVAAARSADASTFDELEGAVVTVTEGTDAGTQWRQTQANGVIGTNDIIWTSFGSSAPSASESTAGIAEIATQAETDAGSLDDKIVTPAKLAAYSGRKLKYSTTVGDASNTQFTITHNLNTRAVLVQVYLNSGNYDTVECDVERTGVNTVRVTFASAPSADAYAVTVLG